MTRGRTKAKPASLLDDMLSVLQDKSYLQQAREARESGDLQNLYKVQPVDIEEFVTSKEYLGQNMYGLSESQLQVLRDADDLENGISRFILWVGKGGGKDFITRCIFLRLTYRLLCMHSPQMYLGLPDTDFLFLLNVAANANQARQAFFDPLVNMIRAAGPKAFIDFGLRPDLDIKDGVIDFPKRIRLISGHSQADSLEGMNIFAAVADEIDGDAFQNPDKMWSMLLSSSRSRFNGRERIFAISYSRYLKSNGMIQKLYDEYKQEGRTEHELDRHLEMGEDEHTAVDHSQEGRAYKYPTWEFNPRPDITRATFASAFASNYDEAETIYACNPPSASASAWIKDYERIKASMAQGEDAWPLDFPMPSDFLRNPTCEAASQGKVLDPYNLPFKPWFRGKPGVSYIFCADPGLGSATNGGDAYGICLAHREKFVHPQTGKVYVRPVIDLTFRFTGHMFKEREVQIFAVQKLIMDLKERYGFNIRQFSFDPWNSAEIVQWIAKRYQGVYVNGKHVVNWEDYGSLKSSIFGAAPPSGGLGDRAENGGIGWYYHPILFWELKNLEEDRKKKRVDHKSDTSKDSSDAVAAAVWCILHNWRAVESLVADGQTTTQKMMQQQQTDTATGSTLRDKLNQLYLEIRSSR